MSENPFCHPFVKYRCFPVMILGYSRIQSSMVEIATLRCLNKMQGCFPLGPCCLKQFSKVMACVDFRF